MPRAGHISADDRSVAVAAFRKVFRRFAPYGSPFQPSVAGRLLVYEPDPWERTPWGLETAGLRALTEAADRRDLERAFVAVVDPQDGDWSDNLYALAPLSLDAYEHSPPQDAWPIVPHALYPASGAWGFISSDESHTLIGGSEPFIAELSARLRPDQDEMIAAWLEEWSEHQDRDPEGIHRIGDWIPAQLAHVVGRERAEAALRASRLRRWPLPA